MSRREITINLVACVALVAFLVLCFYYSGQTGPFRKAATSTVVTPNPKYTNGPTIEDVSRGMIGTAKDIENPD